MTRLINNRTHRNAKRNSGGHTPVRFGGSNRYQQRGHIRDSKNLVRAAGTQMHGTMVFYSMSTAMNQYQDPVTGESDWDYDIAKYEHYYDRIPSVSAVLHNRLQAGNSLADPFYPATRTLPDSITTGITWTVGAVANPEYVEETKELIQDIYDAGVLNAKGGMLTYTYFTSLQWDGSGALGDFFNEFRGNTIGEVYNPFISDVQTADVSTGLLVGWLRTIADMLEFMCGRGEYTF